MVDANNMPQAQREALLRQLLGGGMPSAPPAMGPASVFGGELQGVPQIRAFSCDLEQPEEIREFEADVNVWLREHASSGMRPPALLTSGSRLTAIFFFSEPRGRGQAGE